MLGKRAAPIKSVLLDQTVAAGVGNWVAGSFVHSSWCLELHFLFSSPRWGPPDEILYQARIHPLQQAKTLTDDELGRVREKMCEICRIAVECESESERYPPDWLFLYRWGKGKSKKLKKGEVGDVKGPQVTLVSVSLSLRLTKGGMAHHVSGFAEGWNTSSNRVPHDWRSHGSHRSKLTDPSHRQRYRLQSS